MHSDLDTTLLSSSVFFMSTSMSCSSHLPLPSESCRRPRFSKAGHAHLKASGSRVGGPNENGPSHDAPDLSGINNLPLVVSVGDVQKRAENKSGSFSPSGEARISAQRHFPPAACGSQNSRYSLPVERVRLHPPVLPLEPVSAAKPAGFLETRRRLDPSWAPAVSISVPTHELSNSGGEYAVCRPSPSAYQPRAPPGLLDPFPSPSPGAPDARSQVPRWAREEYLSNRQAGVSRRRSFSDTGGEGDEPETSEDSWPPETTANVSRRLDGEEGMGRYCQTAGRCRRGGSTRRPCFLPSCVRRRSTAWARQRAPMRHHILDSSSSSSSSSRSPCTSSSSTRLPPPPKSANPMRKTDWAKAIITVAVAVPIGLVVVPVVVGPYAAFKWGLKKGKKLIQSRKGTCNKNVKSPWSPR